MIRNGDIIGGMYQIIREIGWGGIGVIYLAEHLRLQKKVVVKRVKDNCTGRTNVRAEADILKRLHHSYLPQVFDFLVVGDGIYTVMEYVEGQDLQKYMNQGYYFPEETLSKWLMQLCEVLEYLHSQRPPILHSDIKPSNIMITREGNVCLIDFNISLDGDVSKDLQGVSGWFAAPEQCEKAKHIQNGEKDRIILDARMDIFSLGAVFYSAMTGRFPPLEKGQCQDILYMELPYSEGIRAVVAKAMRIKPPARFQTAGQMKKALFNVSRMDPQYRRYTNLQMGSLLVWLICIVTGILLLYYGNQRNNLENWQKAYRKLYISVSRQEDAEIISRSTEMLNSYKYKAYLKQNEEQKAELLHVLGETYFRQADYKEAAEYYEEAWKLRPDEGGCLRDYIIALVRDGQITKAKKLLVSDDVTKNPAQDGPQGLSQGERLLIEAEVCYMAEDYDGALKGIEELRELETSVETGAQGTDTGVLYEGLLLLSDVYSKQEKYGEAVTVLEEAAARKESREVLRRMGRMAVEAADAGSQEVLKNSYLEKALKCYRKLNQDSRPSYEDRMNLALLERAVGQYEDSNATLKDMRQTYREDYRIPMWMCYNYLDLARMKGSYEGISEELAVRFQDSSRLYRISGQEDSDMEELLRIMAEVEE